jgi:hypothetical protein
MVVSTAVLSTDDGQAGLRGEYFLGENLVGTPGVVPVDKMVDVQFFHPDASALTPPSGMKEFSARWTGLLTPAESDIYQIGLTGSMN